MYSPNREPRIAAANASSPAIRALTPIVDVIKNAQTTASRDFDRFYDNLWARLSPKTSNSRIRKRTPDTTERMKSILQQKRNEIEEYNSTRTSLTPLIERHSIRDDARARYEYSRNPFYRDSSSSSSAASCSTTQEEEQESIIAETPGLDRGETPNSFYSSSIVNSPSKRSIFSTSAATNNNSSLNAKLAEERKRMDRLQSNMTKIRRQSSFLAEESTTTRKSSFIFEEEDDDVEEELLEEKPTFSVVNNYKRPSHLYQPQQQQQQTPHYNNSSLHQLATPPQSIDYNNTAINTNKTRSPTTTTTTTTTKRRIRSPTKRNISPATKRVATTSFKQRFMNLSPKRIIIDDIPSSSTKLRSTEMISTPGGSMVSNRFWKEIHGLNAIRSPTASTCTTPITKRISTLEKSNSSSQTWANDDQFWNASSSNAPIASSFNNKLFRVAQQEEIEAEQQKKIYKFGDDIFKNDTPSLQQQSQWSRRKSVSPTPSLFNNKLFKAAKGHEQEEEEDMRFSPKTTTFITNNNTHNTTSSPAMATATASLSDELKSAKKRDEILKRNNIPKMNPNLLAELKAKHCQARIIDDSDSYKFT